MKVKDTIEILQVQLPRLSDDIILEKNPIVISENVVNCQEVIDNSFKYLYTSEKEVVADEIPHMNRFQYLIIQYIGSQWGSVIVGDQVHLKLYSGNILILPWRWKYQLKNKDFKLIGLHSFTSALVRL